VLPRIPRGAELQAFTASMKPETVVKATEMLAALLERGATYREAGAAFGVGHSTVERQVKALLLQVSREDGIPGVDDPTLASLALLRQYATSVMKAVRAHQPAQKRPARAALEAGEIAAGVNRIRRLSDNPNRDVALLYVLFCTGAKPLEIARLVVRDYLSPDGTVRRHSELGGFAAVRGRTRPLYFDSSRACAAIDAYLEERVRRRVGVVTGDRFRGLDPDSALFLTERGRPFAVRRRGPRDPRPTSPILVATYRVIFRRAGGEGVTAQSIRRLVAQRLAEKGADKEQVGQLLGLVSNRSVKRLLERPRQPLASLVKDLV
jgi:integrase